MSPVHAWLGAATVKLRCSRLGAIGRLCRLSVVTRKRRWPRARIPCCRISFCTRCLHANTLSTQCAPDARPAVSSAMGHIHGADMHQQCFRAQVPTSSDVQASNKVLMIASHAYPEHPALHADRPHPPMASNQGVLHFCPLAKYAIAFPRMSRSIVTRASSARRRLISICSAVTFDRLSAPCRLPSRWTLTQLNNVCSTRPNVRDAAALPWPDSTSRTASCLNSSVYRARVTFVICIPFADSQLRDTFRAGNIICRYLPYWKDVQFQ